MSDALIRALIQQAEAASPQTGLEIEVLKPASPPADLQEAAYQQLRRSLGGSRRAMLDQDYEVWKSLHMNLKELIATSTSQAAMRESPLVQRLETMRLRPPTGWRICSKCGGSGDGEIGYCRGCKGCGYTI